MVRTQIKMMKTKWYPQPHDMKHAYGHGMETAASNRYTIYPIVMYDEGLGTPSANETHPEHAAFAESPNPNCFVDSRVDAIFTTVQFSLTKLAIETDKVTGVKCCFMPIFGAFLEDWTAADELSSETIKTVLEMQTESTDRQAFPLWAGGDMPIKWTASSTLGAAVPGLT